MRIIVDTTTLTGCYAHPDLGTYYWTAGQRIDPSTESPFVWRVTSTDAHSNTISAMSFTNWGARQPDYKGQVEESCMHLWSRHSYTWNDLLCDSACCSVCELDM